VIPQRLSFMFGSYGTLCSIFMGRANTTYEDGTDRVFRNVCAYNSDAGESPQKKEYNIHNTAKV